MLGRTPGAAAKPVEELVDAQLIQAAGPRVGTASTTCCASTPARPPEDRPEALSKSRDRLLTWYLNTAIAAVHTVSARRSNLPAGPAPGKCPPSPFRSASSALSWLDAERENLVAATVAAAASGPAPVAWQLPVFLHVYFDLRGHFADWITTHEIGLGAARRGRDRGGQAWTLSSLAAALILLERPAEAITHLRRAVSLHREAGQDNGHANSLNSLGISYAQLGDTGRSIRYLHRALAMRRRTGDLHGQAMTLGNLAMAHRQGAQLAVALGYADQAVLVARQVGDERLQGNSLTVLGDLLRAAGRLDEAIDVLSQAVGIEHEAGTKLYTAEAFSYLGRAYADSGQADLARDAWTKALPLYGPLNGPQGRQGPQLPGGAAGGQHFRPRVISRGNGHGSAASGAGQAGLVGEDDRLDPVAQAELGQDPGDVGLHRRLAEGELGGEFGVAQAAGQQAQDLASRGVSAARSRWMRRARGRAGRSVRPAAG